ncbi:F-box protein At3g47030-like [Capsella rubella]|uniref:F-box protein At3g47030-like n=1 Tax=Capsella rubella TaxID=81985 RepID=UPI000CD5A4F2|nr:F-box protein At3g47030-like [Capsella rubella]
MEAQENQVPKMNPLSISERSIPIDLLISVFSRLPVKSIGRCRCVSKQWSYILRRRDFTDLYLKTSSTRPCLLFNLKVNGKCLFLSAPQDQISSSVLVADRRMSFPTEDASCGVSRPVCGLVCSLDMNPSICNTSTGQCITLPKMKIASGGGTVNVYFGYEPVRKLFKVLRKSKDDYRVMTLGRGELSWRIVESSVAHSSLSNGICINGFMYYIAVRNDPRCLKPIMLVCFDMSLENVGLWVLDDAEEGRWSSARPCLLLTFQAEGPSVPAGPCGFWFWFVCLSQATAGSAVCGFHWSGLVCFGSEDVEASGLVGGDRFPVVGLLGLGSDFSEPVVGQLSIPGGS